MTDSRGIRAEGADRRKGPARFSGRGSSLTHVWAESEPDGSPAPGGIEWHDLEAWLGPSNDLAPPAADEPGSGVPRRPTKGKPARLRILTTRRWAIPCLALWLAAVGATLDARASPELDRARELVGSGQRGEAVRILQEHLQPSPGDVDARIYLGTVLSWDEQYDEAREQLLMALSASPRNSDAVRALLNVELWSGHPARAEAIASEALTTSPNSADLHLARAKALSAMGKTPDALAEVDHVLVLDMNNEAALTMRRALRETPRPWLAGLTYYHDWFSDSRSAWDELAASLRRQTKYGSVIGRYSVANHFDTTDDQLEIEAYPRIRSGTYAYLNYGRSLDSDVVYPEYRVGLELYQGLGHGFEVSLGYRRLYFPRSDGDEVIGSGDLDGDGVNEPIQCSMAGDPVAAGFVDFRLCQSSAVNIYTASLGKYYRSWLFLGRIYSQPDSISESRSYHVSARRFLSADGEEYWEVRYAHGRFREEVRTLDDFVHQASDTIAATLVLNVGKDWQISLHGSVSREDRLDLDDLRQYGVSIGLFRKF